MAMSPFPIIAADNAGPGELNGDEKTACKLCVILDLCPSAMLFLTFALCHFQMFPRAGEVYVPQVQSVVLLVGLL